MITSEDKDKKVRFQNLKRWPKLVLARHPKTKSNFEKPLWTFEMSCPKKVSFRGQLKPTRSSGLSSCIISKLADCSIMCILQQISQHLAEKKTSHMTSILKILCIAVVRTTCQFTYGEQGEKKSRTTHRTWWWWWWWWWCKNGEERDAGFMRKTVAKRELQNQLNVTFWKGAGMWDVVLRNKTMHYFC